MAAEAQEKSGTAKIIIGLFVVMAAIAFAIGALGHLQLISFFGIPEPRIIPAAIVEGLCSLFYVISAYKILRGGNAWRITFFAHAFSIAGIILGQISLAVGAGPRTESNDIYHSVMLLFIISDAFYLLTEKGRAALTHSDL
jgi:hypothetical protein